MPADQLTDSPAKQPTEWPQFVIEFADPATAEDVAVIHLRAELTALQEDGRLSGWWFVRKAPYWRLRYPPEYEHAHGDLAEVLDGLVADGQVTGWTNGIYEPEVFAFGGNAGMDVAHELFHADSRNILAYLARRGTGSESPELDRRELALLLISGSLRAAGLDWYEQGDVWARVAHHRTPADTATTPEHLSTRLRAATRRLMTVDAGSTSRLVDGGSLSAIANWTAAFERAGRRLAGLARNGALERGLRAILAHHVIFHWNRLGLPYDDQATLATLARHVVMGPTDNSVSTADSISTTLASAR